MQYIPVTDDQEKRMLEEIGVQSFEDLVTIIPEGLRWQDKMGLEPGLSEMELESEALNLTDKNQAAGNGACFLGGGVYDHYIPKVVDFLSNRSEFYTAYTPYQAEVSQGTLQVMYEFQSMICALSAMDVANASLYDGGSALAEASSMALALTRKKKILISETVNPRFIEVTRTYLQNRDAEIIILPSTDGLTDLSFASEHLDDAAALVIQSPNFYGILEDWTAARQAVDGGTKCLLIGVSDPISLSIICPPGACGADIFVGEGQVLGNSMSFGGPYLGLLSVKSKYMRKLPGRISGQTVDKDGKTGYVLTLQTREQHIRRENATSNICTNQGLMALRAAIYMSVMGKDVLPKVAELCFKKAQFAAQQILETGKYLLPYGDNFIKEFIIQCKNGSAKEIIRNARAENLFIGAIPGDSTDSLLQIAVTEKRSLDEINKLTDFLARQ